MKKVNELESKNDALESENTRIRSKQAATDTQIRSIQNGQQKSDLVSEWAIRILSL